MRAIVTGGAGFIGSHIVDYLMERGHEVTVIDNMLTGHPEFIRHHLDSKNFTFVKMDLHNFRGVREIFEGRDIVFHLAANADIRHGLEDTYRDLDRNLLTTYNVMEAARLNDIKEVVFSSSSAIYGEAKVVPTPEDYFPIQNSFYGASKLAGEAFIEAFSEGYGIKSWIFRYVSIVGERHPHGVTYDFVKKLKENPKELEILGDGTQRKSFLHVDDCVNGIMYAYEHSKERVNIFNLGTEEFTTVRNVADIVTDEMGLKDVRYRFTGGDRGWVGDAPMVFLSIEKMKKLGWRPKVSIEEGIRRTVRWLLENPYIYG